MHPDAPELKDQTDSTKYLPEEQFSQNPVPWLATPTGLTDGALDTLPNTDYACRAPSKRLEGMFDTKISTTAQNPIKPLRSLPGAVREHIARSIGKKKAHGLEEWGLALIMVLSLLAVAVAMTRGLPRDNLHGWHDAATPPEHANGGCARTAPGARAKEDVASGVVGGGGGGSWDMTANGLKGGWGAELQRATRTQHALVKVSHNGLREAVAVARESSKACWAGRGTVSLQRRLAAMADERIL